MERKVLGRGLESLIPVDTQSREKVQAIKVSQIKVSRFQPRLNFSEEKIQELARSIQEKGVIQPVLVRPTDQGEYELVAGERRLRAVKQLGLDEIPAIIRRIADADVLETALIENIQREELNPLDEARAYRRLLEEFGLTQDSVATRVGKDKSSISNMLRILNLPENIQNFVSQNLISFGHARALLGVLDEARQFQLCEEIIQKGLSVRQAESMAQGKKAFTRGSRKRTEKQADIHVRDLEERLRRHFGTKVRVLHGRKRGKLVVEYYSLEDLDRILKLVGVEVG